MPVRLLLLAILLHHCASAAYLVGNVGDDTQFGNYMKALGIPGYQNFPATTDYSQELFSVQAKYGSNSATGNNELGLHWNAAPLSTPPTNDSPIAATSGSIQYVWGAAGTQANVAAGNLINALLDFTIARVNNTITATFRSGSTIVYQSSFTNSTIGGVELIAIRARSGTTATTTASRVKLENIVLNGVAMGNMGNVTTAANSSTATNYVIRDVFGDYTLTGQTTMDWSGGAPGNAALAWQVKNFTVPVPEPSTFALLPAAALLLLLRRK